LPFTTTGASLRVAERVNKYLVAAATSLALGSTMGRGAGGLGGGKMAGSITGATAAAALALAERGAVRVAGFTVIESSGLTVVLVLAGDFCVTLLTVLTSFFTDAVLPVAFLATGLRTAGLAAGFDLDEGFKVLPLAAGLALVADVALPADFANFFGADFLAGTFAFGFAFAFVAISTTP